MNKKIIAKIKSFFGENKKAVIVWISTLLLIIASLLGSYVILKPVLIQKNKTSQRLLVSEKTLVGVEWSPVVHKVESQFNREKIESAFEQYKLENKEERRDGYFFSGMVYETTDDFIDLFDFYFLGYVSEGKYDGNELYYIKGPFAEGPMLNLFKAVKTKENDFVILDSCYFDNDFLYSIFKIDESVYFLDGGVPEEIEIPNSDYKLIKENRMSIMFAGLEEKPEKLFKYDNDHYVYLVRDCVVAIANDGTLVSYTLSDYPFLLPQEDGGGDILDIKWNNGEQNKDAFYDGGPPKCGGPYCVGFSFSDVEGDELQIAGTTPTGEKFYELKNLGNSQIAIDLYNQYYPGWDDETGQEKEKMPFEDFLQTRPVVYWKSPLGRYIAFENTKYIPMAECGKPVIYLYPEKETDVNVKVYPSGGFTETIPKYNNGWFVRANPNGEVYNYEDGQNYPYLFWEGRGANYRMPQKGFTVARDEVEQFLEEKLAKLGLIEKEYDEFIEFWAPKMKKYPYYFVSFVPQEEFDKMAPLEVEPRPDTVIRVFMDYKGLDEKIEVGEQLITTPKRQGFTVVEWGGELRD